MRTMDVFYAFPSILLAIAICGLLGNGLSNSVFALSVVFIPPMVRIAETVPTQTRQLDFVEAARASGTSTPQIVRYQVLANVLGSIMVYATSLISVGTITLHPPDCVFWDSVSRRHRLRMYFLLGLPAPSDLCAALRRGTAGCDDLHHLHVLQSDEQRLSQCNGCEAEQVTFATIKFHPRHSRDGVAAKFPPHLLREGQGGGVPIA